MLPICGVSFILGFTFANSAVFLNLTLLHTPKKHAHCLFPLTVSPWAHKNRRMPEYCSVPSHPLQASLHDTTHHSWNHRPGFLHCLLLSWLAVLSHFHKGLFSAAFISSYFSSFYFFFSFLHAKGTSGKGFFSMSRGIISILHNLSPFSVSLH